MNKFKVNAYITLVLEEGSTIIYVAGERFSQCKFLLLNIPIKKVSTFNEIESIDETSERLDKSMDYDKIKLPPEIEFWGHCSNMQVWYENNYDTRLLHSNLAFPLLAKLMDVGDPLAIKVFKEELVKRFESGYSNTISYLIEEGYHNCLKRDEFLQAVIDPKELNPLLELEGILQKQLKIYANKEIQSFDPYIIIENQHIIELYINDSDLNFLPEVITSFKALKLLDFRNNEIEEFPKWIDELNNLYCIDARGNKIYSISDGISKLKKLEYLFLNDCPIKNVTDKILQNESLKYIELHSKILSEQSKKTLKKIESNGIITKLIP